MSQPRSGSPKPTWPRRALPAVGALALAGALTAAAQPPALAHSGTATTFNADLQGVDTLSATDAWAVGSIDVAQNGNMILHFDGSTWSQVPAPALNQGNLYGISMASASDGWAVGTYYDQTTGSHGVLLHWNGSTWSRVPTPSPGAQTTGGSVLSAVSDVSGTDAWAVGSYGTARHRQKTLTLHWNGTVWTQQASPSPSHKRSTQLSLSNELAGVSALPGSQAWTAGDYHADTGQTAMTLHWTGTAWAKVANPGGNVQSMLQAISMRSATDGWAVGKNYNTGTAILLHWNGSTWTEF